MIFFFIAVSRKPSLMTSAPSTPVSVTPEKKERKESSETSSGGFRSVNCKDKFHVDSV